MKPLVIYHGNCIDGFTAAWAVQAWLEVTGIAVSGAEPEYFAAHYAPEGKRVQLPDVTGRSVWMVDFCTGREQLLELKAAAAEFVVLDHHKTAQAACEGLDFCTFDMNRSGAMLAWDQFFEHELAPWFVRYVQDRDLWRFELERSREVNAFLQSQPMTMENWDALRSMQWREAADRGKGALDYIERYVREMKLQARRGPFAGHDDIPVVNAPYISISELVGALGETAPFAVGWFQNSAGMYVYSLRSRGDFDVSALAQQFGGGGHKNAAGFTVGERVTL
jgi:oligoribonuclease NrnB/cAMP/cGMP phosphodiesterase (DHH superfamily)